MNGLDPEIAPLPLRIKWQQAENFSMVMLKGDPETLSAIKKAFK